MQKTQINSDGNAIISVLVHSTQRFFEHNFVANDPSCLAAQNLLLCGVYLVYLTDCKPLNFGLLFFESPFKRMHLPFEICSKFVDVIA
jgi:hypothetical protein